MGGITILVAGANLYYIFILTKTTNVKFYLFINKYLTIAVG